jgi:hypothetical protein
LPRSSASIGRASRQLPWASPNDSSTTARRSTAASFSRSASPRPRKHEAMSERHSARKQRASFATVSISTEYRPGTRKIGRRSLGILTLEVSGGALGRGDGRTPVRRLGVPAS